MNEDWNNLKHNKLEDILKIWRQHIKPEYWEDEKISPGCCKELCSIKND